MADYKIQVIPVLKKGEVQKQLNEVGKGSNLGKKLGASWGQQLGMELKHKLDYAVFSAGGKAIKDMIANVKELNAAQTELRKVSSLEGAELERFTSKAYEAGESVAKTGTQMVEAATEWKKAGYDEKQILQLSKVSSMYQNISDSEISAGEATNFIISQLKAFNKDASESEHIIDAVNNVSNNMAVSSYDLATNIGKASAAMSTGGNTYEQTLGLTK